MAERQQAASRAQAVATSRGRAATSTGIGGASVRRNLFPGNLSRRPTSTSVSSASTDQDPLRLGSGLNGGGDGASTLFTPAPGSNSMPVGLPLEGNAMSSDIVVRDKNGEVELLDDPPSPVTEDEVDDMGLDARIESEKERQRLAEAVKQHQIDQSGLPVQQEELLEAVRASLRAKVAALSEDNWMYEREDPPRFQ